MEQTGTDPTKNKPSPSNTFINQDAQNTYDAFDFLYNYNSDPIGDYPEISAEASHKNKTKTNFQYE